MAKQQPQIPGVKGSGLSELWARLRFVILAIFVYRIGAHIPVPGIDPEGIKSLFGGSEGTIIDMVNMFSGGALERMSILALGVMPYISASIIMQLLTAVTPSLEQLRKEGEAGRRKISQYTRIGTVILAAIQGFGICAGLVGQGATFSTGLFDFYVPAVVSFVTGAVFLMWLGEQITERGIGNGISLIIFAGIVAGLPSALAQSFKLAKDGDLNVLLLLFIVFLAVALVALIVYIERGQRRITVNYAKRQQGNKVYAGQSSHLPLKVNMAGVIPAIFASSILLFPATIGEWFGKAEGMEWLQSITGALGAGQPLNTLLFAAGIIFFCFFYTAIVFNPKDVAENLKKSGAFIPGIRPGQQSADYIDKVTTRLTVFGALYMTFICLIPQWLIAGAGVPFYLGGTSLLIVVVVIMDFMSQVQTHLMSHHYETLLKKSNLKGYGR